MTTTEMSGMDRLTDEKLAQLAHAPWTTRQAATASMARELLAHRRASQATPVPSDGLREENERLRAHIRTMQGYVQEYLEPIPYVAKHGAGGTFHEPHRHQDEGHAYFMRQQMREAVLNDLIHMLEGPEERAALAKIAQEG